MIIFHQNTGQVVFYVLRIPNKIILLLLSCTADVKQILK